MSNIIKNKNDYSSVKKNKKIDYKKDLYSFINYLNTFLKNKLLKQTDCLSNYFEYRYQNGKKVYSVKNILTLFSKKPNKFQSFIIYNQDKKDYIRLLKEISIALNNKDSLLNDNIRQNIIYILSYKFDNPVLINNQHINRPSYLKKVKLNNDFIINIIKNIPTHFSDLEKAIYIYIKLCDILTHDYNDLYRNSYTINHKDINRLKDINENNNVVVCYEFVAIFAKILELYNIEYEIGGDNRYGRGHTYLKLIYKDSIICFDATRGIVDCDMTKVKNNIRTCNILPIEASSTMLKEIDLSIEKVYNFIEEKEKKIYYYENDYIKKNQLNENIDYINRINLFCAKICESHLPPVDKIKYIYLLKKILFNNNEMDLSVIENELSKNISIASVIVSFNINNEYIYYLYDFSNKIEKITKEEIKKLFENGLFKYIKFLKSDIPGFDNSVENNAKKKILNKK